MKVAVITNKTYMQQANYNRNRLRKAKYIYVDNQYIGNDESSILEVINIPTPIKIPVIKSKIKKGKTARINTVGRWKQKKKDNGK